ncbi:alginate lyase family protein [Telluribacter sp. SYSU D00476]|uniref:alginate lyase family protein n=1 Tax=Telluribacter sp. SYSU D00476 TaxID=2811430 RepID=UPI001FF5E8A1|nr:alginate lyase family protein [Telluribacter sp. SYSU D00476]
MKHYLYLVFLLLLSICAEAQVRQTLLLTAPQQREVTILVKTNPEVQALWKPVEQEAKQYLSDQPRPRRVIYYEGLLDTNPDRIQTTESLKDLDKVAVWLSAWYGTQEAVYANKIKGYLLAWVDTYQPTGNPINENKLEPLVYSYQVLKKYFSKEEKRQVDQWLTKLAEAEMAFPRIPENNWKAKHIKLVGTIGLVLQKPQYVAYAQEQFKTYIDRALYADGTSRDLIERDALSYHVSGLDPLLIYALTVEQLGDKQDHFRPFTYQSPEGGSIQKSIDYVVPYARKEKVHKEWVNTKVELDRQRAKAGLEHYQPGRLYEPESSVDLFTLASYFHPHYRDVVRVLRKEGFKEYDSWLSVLVEACR